MLFDWIDYILSHLKALISPHFRNCAKLILNIKWQNLEEEGVRRNFLVSLSALHAKLTPRNFRKLGLLEELAENPWTDPTLAKVMGGECEEEDKDEGKGFL